MFVRVDPGSSEPLFAQIVAAAKHAVATGRLKAGDRMPSVRELAKELLINPNTIQRAYQALEAEGVTISRRGSGTFIADRKIVVKSDERRRRFREELDAALSEAVHLGLTEEEVERVFAKALKRFRFNGSRKEEQA